eukprot:jgi/Chrzof1/1855/Cz10g23240.t1
MKSSASRIETTSQQPSVVITGASTGIGQETAVLLANKGWRVFAGVRSNAAAEQLAGLNDNITAVVIDVTKQDTVDASVQHISTAVGDRGLQGLVNNAGKAVLAPAEFMPLQTFKDVMEVNVVGVLRTSQAFLPLLRGPQKGRIVNISSVAGTMALPLFGAYNASKHALEGLSDSMRYDLAAQGVAVVIIKPGPVKTPIWSKSRDVSQQLMQLLPPIAQQLYGTLIHRMSQEVQYSEENGIPAADVANIIHEALTAQRPRTRYILGNESSMHMLAKRVLPDWMWDKILLSYLDVKS